MTWAICTSSAGARRRVEKRGRFDVGEKLVIPQEKVIELVQEMQKKMNMKAGFKNTGFVPNWANWIVSQRDRQMKPVALVEEAVPSVGVKAVTKASVGLAMT